MRIGIFSKLEMLGGSERRCIELANGIAEFTEHDAFLFSEGKIPEQVVSLTNIDEVVIASNVFKNSNPKTLKLFESMDKIVVINTDSKDFTHIDYWNGKSHRHDTKVNLSNIKDITFLFNFIVSPSRHLYTLKEEDIDVRIITANSKFFKEISSQDRYERVRDIPRMKLESPISKHSVDFLNKRKDGKIRFGMHSKSLENKWNVDWEKVIKKANQRLGENRFEFNFMGIKNDLAKKIKLIRNVNVYKENHMSVRDFLNEIDVFTFFPSWDREEPWARVVGEAMMSGCPIVATSKGGNIDQIINGNNGFLFKSSDDLFKHIVHFVEHPEQIETMGKNSRRMALDFTTDKVVGKMVEFISKD